MLAALAAYFFAQGDNPLSSALFQYGAVGVLALCGLAGIKVLFQGERKTLELERARVVKLEEELRRLNESIHTQYVPTLTKASEAIAELLKVARER